MNIYIEAPTASPTSITDKVITPRVGGGQNYKTYWVSRSNISPVTREKSIQARRPNDFRSASIIAKNCTEGLLEKRMFPWRNPKARSLLWVGSPGLGSAWRRWNRHCLPHLQSRSKNWSLPCRLLGVSQRWKNIQVGLNPKNYRGWGRKRKFLPVYNFDCDNLAWSGNYVLMSIIIDLRETIKKNLWYDASCPEVFWAIIQN